VNPNQAYPNAVVPQRANVDESRWGIRTASIAQAGKQKSYRVRQQIAPERQARRQLKRQRASNRKLNDGALPLDGHPRLDCLADLNRQHPPAHDEGRTILFVIDRLAFKSAAGF